MENQQVMIFDIMACNVYWDFENSPLPKEQHKFLVALYPTPGVATPDLIGSLTAYGPGGYVVSFENQMFTNDNKNGWIYDPNIPNYWYMVNLPTGFMEAGEYTIEIRCTDGSVVKKSRIQKNAPSEAVVDAYVKNRQILYDSFSPSEKNPLPPGAPLENISCSWSTLKDVAGPDCYYVYRLAEASTSMEFDTQNLAWFDNIYIQRLRDNDETAGFNKNGVTVGTALKPETSYGYFVEITDANIAGEANICIFQPHQFFVTP